MPDANNSHTRIVAEIVYEVLAEAERTLDNAEGDPAREDYVSDVIRVLQTQLDSGFWREAESPLDRRVWDDRPGYVLHYVSQDAPGAPAWSVYQEEYLTLESAEPIDGSQVRLAWYPTEAQANEVAGLLQKGSNRSLLHAGE